jgi:hypothetical protein
MKQKNPQECCCCRELTKYICIDCSIDRGKFIALCEKSQCRDTHEEEKHRVNISNAS